MIKFLEPLENPPGINQKNKSPVKKSSPHKTIETKENGEKEEKTPKSPEKKMPEKSVLENGPDAKAVNHTDTPVTTQSSESVTSTEPPVVTTRPIATEMLNSNNKNTQSNNKSVHLTIPEKGNTSVNNHSVQEHPGVTSPTSKRGANSVANSRSFSSDSSLGDPPTGQVLTTVAQVHREDSTLMGAGGSVTSTVSPSASSERSLGGESVSTNGNNDATSSDATVEEVTVTTPTNVVAPCARLTETILENDSTGSDLSQLSETSDRVEQLQERGSNTSTPTKDGHASFSGEEGHYPHPEWHHNKEQATSRTPVESRSVGGKDIQVNRTDSGYASASSVTKSTNLNHVQSQSTQTSEDTLAETSQENQVPFADEGDSMDGNSLSSQPDVLEGVEGATQSPRPSVASSTGSDESEVLDMDSLENALMSNSKNLDVPSAKRLAKRLYTLDGFKRSDVAKHLSKRYVKST